MMGAMAGCLGSRPGGAFGDALRDFYVPTYDFGRKGAVANN